MGLSIGLVGLPNVGKSTLFNALTGAQNAQVANYPFCTIKPNRAIVPVPDPRVEKLAELVGVPNTIHATIEFVDIAGLVKGASQGEGLGNQFLGHIRDTAAIVHVVRCFDDPNVVHISAQPDPVTDIEIVNLELVLADIQQLERKIERLSSQAKAEKKARPMLEFAQTLHSHLQNGEPVASFPDRANEFFPALNHELRFLTAKPVIYAANVDETGLAGGNVYLAAARQAADKLGAEVVVIGAELEAEIADLTPDERAEYLLLAGAERSGLELILQIGFQVLGLISFFTKNENEVRAWNIPQGTPAPQAAGTIHTDMERGFIRAEVVPYEVFVQHGSDAHVRAKGLLRLEGKDYIVQDGDIIYFRFNV